MFFKSSNYKNSNDTMELVSMAEDLRAKYKFRKSLKPANKAIEIEPGNYMGWDAKGVAYRHLGQFDESRNCFEKALALLSRPDVIYFPDLSIPEVKVHILNDYANLLTILSKFSHAIVCYTESIEICRKVIEERKKSMKDAPMQIHDSEMKRVVAKIDNMILAKLYRNRARCNSYQKENTKAIDDNKKSLEYENRDFVYSNIAQSCFELKNVVEMEYWLKKGIGKFPDSPFINFAYASYYSYINDFISEKKALQKFLRHSKFAIDPDLIGFKKHAKKRLNYLLLV